MSDDLKARLRHRQKVSVSGLISDDPLTLEAADALDAHDAEIARLREALRPFANAVYNDNGDVTVQPCGIDEYYAAYRVLKKDTTHDR